MKKLIIYLISLGVTIVTLTFYIDSVRKVQIQNTMESLKGLPVVVINTEYENNIIPIAKKIIKHPKSSLKNIEKVIHKNITSKDIYLNGNLSIKDENQKYDNLKIEIRKRGNTTFGQAKAPYKIKLSKEDSSDLFGLGKGRSWILLANFHDESMMANILAFKIAKFLNMPFTHEIVPVELVLNGEYQGVYYFTTHKEVGKNRVDIGKNGVFLELTRSKGWSKDPKNSLHYLFTSSRYMLPVLIRNPDLDKLAKKDELKAKKLLAEIKDNFNQFEKSIDYSDLKKYGEYIDKKSIAQLLLVHFITKNGEINHPKSIYIHKREDDKYSFGPVWDFDWAYGGSSGREFFVHGAEGGLFGGNQPGAIFFQEFLKDPEILKIFKSEWQKFKQDKYKELVLYMQEYSELLTKTKAYERDYNKWHSLQDKKKKTPRKLTHNEYFEDMKNWLEKRVEVTDKFIVDWEDRLKKDLKDVENIYTSKNGYIKINKDMAYDVYIKDKNIYYISEKCSAKAVSTKFFLHIIPENIDDLSESRKKYGFDNLDFKFEDFGNQEKIKCTIKRELPNYPIKSIRTGQFESSGRVWEAQYNTKTPKETNL